MASLKYLLLGFGFHHRLESCRPLFVFSLGGLKQNARSLLKLVSDTVSTTFLLVQTIQQPIRIFEICCHWSCHGQQNAGYHVKEHWKLYQKQVYKVTLRFDWGHILKKQTVRHVWAISFLNFSWRCKFISCQSERLTHFFSLSVNKVYYFVR